MRWVEHDVTWTVDMTAPPYPWSWTCRCTAVDRGTGLDALDDSVVGHYSAAHAGTPTVDATS